MSDLRGLVGVEEGDASRDGARRLSLEPLTFEPLTGKIGREFPPPASPPASVEDVAESVRGGGVGGGSSAASVSSASCIHPEGRLAIGGDRGGGRCPSPSAPSVWMGGAVACPPDPPPHSVWMREEVARGVGGAREDARLVEGVSG